MEYNYKMNGLGLKTILFLSLLLILPASLVAESNSFEKEGFSFSKLENGEPDPYSADEFPRGLQDLRRFEQIFIGAFPLSLFFAQVLGFFGMSVQQLAVNSVGGTGGGSSTPVEFASENWAIEDKVRVITTGMGISFGIAVIDAILYHTKRKEEESKYKRKRLLSSDKSKEQNETTENSSAESLNGGEITKPNESL